MATSGLSYDNRSSPSGFALGNGKVINDWASEASPTLGCSIEISRDIMLSVFVCRMSYVCRMSKLREAHAHAQSLFWAVKQVATLLFIFYTLYTAFAWTKKKLKKAFT